MPRWQLWRRPDGVFVRGGRVPAGSPPPPAKVQADPPKPLREAAQSGRSGGSDDRPRSEDLLFVGPDEHVRCPVTAGGGRARCILPEFHGEDHRWLETDFGPGRMIGTHDRMLDGPVPPDHAAEFGRSAADHLQGGNDG